MSLNRILEPTARKSSNFFNGDLIFKHFINTFYSTEGLAFMENKLQSLKKDCC